MAAEAEELREVRGRAWARARARARGRWNELCEECLRVRGRGRGRAWARARARARGRVRARARGRSRVRACGSMPEVGSSRKTVVELPVSEMARQSLRFCPPERLSARASRFSASPTCLG